MVKGALGLVETRGLVAALEAADAMVKAANVAVVDLNMVGSGLITVMVEGEVAAVKAAVDIARQRAKGLGDIISTNVIPRPHEEVCKLIEILE